MPYAAINVEGGLFPAELLDDIAAGTAELPSVSALGRDGHRLTEDIQSAFSDARSYWDAFQRRLERSNESRTTLTRQDWMLKFLELIGFGGLSFQRAALDVDGQNYNISHRAGDYDDAPPVHIVGMDQELDRREDTGSRRSPHALVQEYLNRSGALWGLVGNGLVLRLLRDTARLSKPTYLEFDLLGMMEGNQYSEFALLYRLIHSSHFPQPEANAQDCGLEKYYQDGLDQGGRVREHLREGVEECLRGLGTAFLNHSESENLRQKLANGRLDTAGYYRQLLRLVYRFLFLMVAEERRLLFPDEAAARPEQRVYRDYYSIGKLRDRAEHYFRGDTYSDLWLGLRETFHLFRDSATAFKLGLTALDGELFGPSGCPDLEDAHCRNDQLLDSVRHLSTFLDDGGNGRGRRRGQRASAVRRRVNYAGLDVEELGSVYESLLDFHPQVSLENLSFELVSGSERKETGSYYTPPELVRELIDSALVPVIEDRLEGLDSLEDEEAALLEIKVCDPASGSGHFLLAAARHIARELAQVRTGEREPAPSEFRRALRDVIRHCVYAVDKNPLAVDLCKVALWIEGHDAGLPLSFLDHHIKCGDSLVGVFDLEVLARGIPDDAYKPVTDDDKSAARSYQRKNKEEKQGQLRMVLGADTAVPDTLVDEFQVMAELEELTPEDVQSKEEIYASLRGHGSKWLDLKLACDLWTAAFFLPLQKQEDFQRENVPTTGTIRRYLAQPEAGYGPLVGKAVEVSTIYSFFHWPLEFPEVFERGGFDAVLGNPPFLGGFRISQGFGDRYRRYLVTSFAPARGTTDLCAYFFRRAFGLLRETGHFGMVATKTIGQGDTQEGGLAVILNDGGAIVFAQRFIQWPFSANVEVNLVAARFGEWSGLCFLDNRRVEFISSRLDDEPESKPLRLKQNSGKCFKGHVPLGAGFNLLPDEASRLATADGRNAECLFPYLIGRDINSRPDQSASRWIIQFDERSETEARSYPLLWNIVEERVWPDRKGKDAVKYPRMVNEWWKFWNNRREMAVALSTLDRVLIRAQTSETHALAFVPNGWVYDQKTVVFAIDDYYHFGLLQSNIHECWIRKFTSTMRGDLSYAPTDCFSTFPFPPDPTPEAVIRVGQAGEAYYNHRQQILLGRDVGMTTTYNYFHDPECEDPDIERLRGHHAEMDRICLECYGWQDIEPGHGFHQNDRGLTRFTVSPEARRETLHRLLGVNARIASEEGG